MAFGAKVQSATATAASGLITSPTLSAGATAGNLLVWSWSRSGTYTSGGAHPTDSAYTALPQTPIGSGNLATGWAWKISTGGETTVSPTGETNQAGNWVSAISEYEGPFHTTPADVSAEDETGIATAATTITSGTTGTTAQADELALALFGIDSGANLGTTSYTNSFAEDTAARSDPRAAHTIASRVLSATGTYSTTLSYSAGGSGDELYGAIATWKKAAGGAFTLTADAGSYAITGTAATLRATRLLTADAGSYAITGTDATVRATRLLSAAAGAYTITGTDADLIYGVSGAYTLTADPGVYTDTGTAATLRATRLLTAASGAYTVTGSDAALLATRLLSLAPGTYLVTGTAATLTYSGAIPDTVSVIALLASSDGTIGLAASTHASIALRGST